MFPITRILAQAWFWLEIFSHDISPMAVFSQHYEKARWVILIIHAAVIGLNTRWFLKMLSQFMDML